MRHRPEPYLRHWPLLLVLAALAVLASCSDQTAPDAPDPGLPPGWLAGTIGDDTGRPLAGVRVFSGSGGPVAITGADGTFRIGPFAAGDTIVLTTDSPDTVSAPGADDAWYDFATVPFVADTAGALAITLLTRYEIEILGSASWLPSDDHFSHFLEHTVSTFGPGGTSRVWTWDHYPLSIWVDDTTFVRADPGGDVVIDAGACVREGIRRWNDAFGWDILVETNDPRGADVVCAYPPLGRSKPAETAPIDPDECGFRSCRPSRVEIRLSPVHIPDATRFAWMAAHELGHALGFWGHIATNRLLVEDGQPVHSLMVAGGGTYGYPIHLFERRAIIARHHIPAGTALEQYEGTFPALADFPPQEGAGAPITP